jgi:nitric oxide reductase NorE protein
MTNAVETAAVTGAFGGSKKISSGYLPGESSMWFFIIGDLLIFGVYFLSYMYYRGQNHDLFLHSQQHLNQGIGITNTVVLLTSSLFVALGTEAAREGRTGNAFRLMGVAVALGSLFPVLKMVEWIPKISAGFTPGENIFFTFYYVMTGLHLCHVLLGLIILTFVMRDLRVSSKPSIKFVETGAMYWHMVDLLWLFLLAVFYLMR